MSILQTGEIHLETVGLSYGDFVVFESLDLHVTPGEFVAIVGPSGCGKTTLLSVISGHLPPTRGTISRAGIARTVYQHDGLLPWRTAAQNIQLGLRHLPVSEQNEKTGAFLDQIGLSEFGNRYPHELSGGMRQRVEVARALAAGADILLLDEPFSALDYLTRIRMRAEVSRLLQLRGCTTVLVTHDLEEAAQLADRIVVLGDFPARVRQEVCLAAPKPRDPTHPEVVATVRDLLTLLNTNMAPAASLATAR